MQMADKSNNKPSKTYRGSVEILRLKPDFIITDKTRLNNLDRNMYEVALPSSVPLHEIDSPADIFRMYKDGALLIELEDERSETLFDNDRTGDDFWKTGDLILINYYAKMVTVALLLINKNDINPNHQKYIKFKPSRITGEDFYIFNLGNHPNFQQMFWY